MFRRARWRLTIAFAATSIVLFALVAVSIVAIVVYAFDRGLNDEMRYVARVATPLLAAEPPAEEERLETEFGPTFLFAYGRTGTLIANPRDLQAGEVVPAAIVAETLADGEERWTVVTVADHRFRLFVRPVFGDGVLTGVIVAGRDLARRDANVRLIVLALAAATVAWSLVTLVTAYLHAGMALRPVREAYARQEAFVSGAAHELRSPVAVIRAAADIAVREEIPQPARGLVEEIRDVSEDAGQLVDDLLELARMGTPLEQPPTALDAVVADELSRMRHVLDEHDVIVASNLSPVVVSAGPTAIGRAVRALLENVVAHTPRGTHVTLETLADRQVGILRVEDDGPGIPDGDLDQVFEPFTQLSVARTPERRAGGGLGLAIVRGIAQSHGGWARATTPPAGRGLRIDVAFARAPDSG